MNKLIFCFGLLVVFGCTQKNQTNQIGSPVINPPVVTGNYPGTPFLFAVPTQGIRPITWTAEGLPNGLQLDASTGIISGIVEEKGEYPVKLSAENKFGISTSVLTIKIGDLLALTPPMGWNSWNTFTDQISDSLVRQMKKMILNLPNSATLGLASSSPGANGLPAGAKTT